MKDRIASAEARLSSLRARFPPGTRLSRATIRDVRRIAKGLLLTFNWDKDVHLYGIRLPLFAPFLEFGYGTRMASWEEWEETLESALLSHLDTGLVENSARTFRRTYIELDQECSWPYAPGWDYQVRHEFRTASRIRITVDAIRFPYEGISVSVHLNQIDGSSGRLHIGGSSMDNERAALDAVHLVCHLAGTAGLQTIFAEAEAGFELIGFRRAPGRGGEARVDTSFNLENIELVRALYPI